MDKNRVKVTFAGSDEIFESPEGYAVEQTVMWAGRLFHSSCHHIKQIGPNIWRVENRKRGVANRKTVITVLA